MSNGIIYLIQPTELIGTKRYKIGRSCKNDLSRLKSYGKGVRYILIRECINPIKFEAEIIKSFNEKFKNIARREYFEGNELEMIDDINTIFSNNIIKDSTIDSSKEIDSSEEIDFKKISSIFPNYYEDKIFNGTKKLIKIFIESFDYINYKITIYDIDKYKEINKDILYINDINDPVYSNINKMITKNIIENNKIYNIDDLIFIKKYNNVILSKNILDKLNINKKTINKIKLLFFYDTIINNNFYVSELCNNYFQIDSDTTLNIININDILYDYLYLRQFIPYIIEFNKTKFYILNRDYEYIKLNTKTIHKDDTFERKYLFNNQTTCWTNDKKYNNKMLNEIIHKYNIYTKNKECLNPDEITFKLFDIFNK